MTQVFEKFPKFKQKMSAEIFKNYKKQIYRPITEKRKAEMAKINKKSVYKSFNF